LDPGGGEEGGREEGRARTLWSASEAAARANRDATVRARPSRRHPRPRPPPRAPREEGSMSAGGEIWVGAERDSQGGGACRGRAEPWSSGWLAGPRARRQSPADLARDLPAGLRAFSLSRSGVPVCGDPCLPSTAVWTVSDSLMSDDPALPCPGIRGPLTPREREREARGS
jgi:hypothetical protein